MNKDSVCISPVSHYIIKTAALIRYFENVIYPNLSYDVASGSEIPPCNKIDKPLVVYRFTGNVITFITLVLT